MSFIILRTVSPLKPVFANVACLLSCASARAQDYTVEEARLAGQEWAQQNCESKPLTITAENDKFTLGQNSDQGYTSGIDIRLTDACRHPDYVTQVALTQIIHTPNIRVRFPGGRDQPYSGALLASATKIMLRGDGGIDTTRLSVGVMGPTSLAAETQFVVHSALHKPKPKGWASQAPTEPVIQVNYQRQWPSLLPSRGNETHPFRLDVRPHAGVALGTIENSAHGGITIMVTERGASADLPVFIGSSVLSSGISRTEFGHGVTMFAGLDVRTIAFDAVAGDSFFSNRGHRISKRPIVAEFFVGAAVTIASRMRLAASFHKETPRFSDLARKDDWGGISFTRRF